MSAARAVVLLSGGLDSATCLAMAAAMGFDLYALTLRYGQRHSLELDAAGAIAAHIGVQKHLIIDLDLGRIGGSALTTDVAVPKGGVVTSSIPVTYVPARNTIFLSIALGWAESVGAHDLFIGVNAVDYSGYPDCRPAFIQSFEKLATLATRDGVEGKPFKVHAPLIHMSKGEIIRKAVALGVDLRLTRSCYDPDDHGRACRFCDACRLRLGGFAQVGMPDPAPYQGGSFHER